MQFIPYLSFNGNCREAFKFYEQCFRGQIVAMFTHAETPAGEHCPAEMQDTIMHARLVVGSATLMGGDAPPDQYQKPGLCISIQVETPEEAERIYRELEPGGEVVMPIQETFWAVRFGMITDRFGIPWMLNCEKPTG